MNYRLDKGDIAKRIKASTLMSLDNDLWDKHGIMSGDDWGRNPDKYNAYKQAIQEFLYKKGISKIAPSVYEKLEDSNHHTLNKTLKDLGMFN